MRRVFLLIVLLAATGAVGFGVTRLESAFDPKLLAASSAAEARTVHAVFANRETDKDQPGADTPFELVIQLDAQMKLEARHYRWVHDLSSKLMEEPWVVSVDSLTVSPIGRLSKPARSLAELEDEAAFEQQEQLESIMLALVESAPMHFPEGIQSLGRAFAGRVFRGGPIGVSGEPLTEAQLEELAEVATYPWLQRRLISADQCKALVVIRGIGVTDQDAIYSLHQLLRQTPAPDEAVVTTLGLPQVRVTLGERLASDQLWLVLASCVLSTLVLLLGFQNLRLVGFAMASVGITMALVLGSMGWLSIPLTLLTNIVPPLLVTLGLGDAVHLLGRYQVERASLAPLPALIRTTRAMWRACLVTSVTTAGGFASLAASQTPALREFGVVAAVAVMAAFAVTVFALPLLLSLSDENGTESGPPRRLLGSSVSNFVQTLQGWALRLTVFSLRRSRWVLLGALLVLAGSAIATSRVRTDAALFDQLSDNEPIRIATRAFERDFAGVRQFELLVEAVGSPDLRARDVFSELAALERWLTQQPLVLQVDGPSMMVSSAWQLATDGRAASKSSLPRGRIQEHAWESQPRLDALFALLTSAPEPGSPHGQVALSSFLSPDGTQARIVVRLRDAPVGQIAQLLESVEQRLSQTPALQGWSQGEAVESTLGLHRVVQDLLVSLPIALWVVLTVMMLLFRSLRLGLVAVPPNLLPLAMVLGYMGLRGIPLHASTVMVLPVTLGLVVDGTIHILAHYRDRKRQAGMNSAAHQGGRTEAVRIVRTLRTTGPAVVLSSLTLLAGFAALSLSSFKPIQLFAELSTVAIASALLAEFTLLPALLAIKRNTQSTHATARGPSNN